MNAISKKHRRAVTAAAQTMAAPFDAFKVAKLCDLSVMDCARSLASLTHEGVIRALGESPEGEPFHVSERYVIALPSGVQ
jgi:hypothetical protein